jgi:hypothetical protein
MVWTISPYLFTSHKDSNHMSVFLIQYKCLLLYYALLIQLVLILTKVDLGFDTDSIGSLRATPRASINFNLYI